MYHLVWEGKTEGEKGGSANLIIESCSTSV